MSKNENRASAITLDAAVIDSAGCEFDNPTTGSVNDQPMLDLALDYARRGWHVFPCSPATKKPETKHGFYDATTDADVIKQFWRKHPTAMIGVACGEKSGVWCLDPDAPTEKNPIDGREELKKLQSLFGADSGEDTHTHITPGGGRHKIYKWRTDRAPITNREGALKGLHINVRGGDKGYFIAAGSINADGIAYRIAEPANAFNFAPAPDWLHDLIEGGTTVPELQKLLTMYQLKPQPELATISQQAAALVKMPIDHLAESANQATNNRDSAYARAALVKECAELAATKINRNNRLNNAALSLGGLVKAGALTEAEVIAALVAACDANGLNKDDGRNATLATIRSGMGAATARVIPLAKPEPGSNSQEPETSPGDDGKVPTAKHGWPFKSAKDFSTEINKPWIIKLVIAPNEISNWCGLPKSGKSALVGDLAMHVCAGLDWRGYRSKQAGGVVYFALERADLVERRWNAQAAQYGLCPEALPFAVVNWTIDMIHPSCIADFIATIRAAQTAMGVKVRMIVIDTSAKAIAAGGGDENQAKDKNVMRANVRRVMLAIEGLHVALISHTGKDVDKGERGSNAGLGDDDVFIQLDGKLADVKQRNDGATGPLTAYAVKGVVLGVDEDGDKVDIGIIDPDTGAAAKAKAGKRDRQMLTNPQRLALTALDRAITDNGKPMPVGSDYPKNVKTCTSLDHWRGVFKSLSDGKNPKSVATSFQRAQVFLKVDGWIGVWNDSVWIAYA
jgi:Bifunctional DNA primase/polymerase, N-terminal/AAA domain